MSQERLKRMSGNGLWTIEFLSTINLIGSGVLVMNNGRLLGGDEGFYYSGSYETTPPNGMSAEIRVTRFKPEHVSVFGDIGQFTLHFQGTLEERSFNGVASVKLNPSQKIRIKGTKKEDL